MKTSIFDATTNLLNRCIPGREKGGGATMTNDDNNDDDDDNEDTDEDNYDNMTPTTMAIITR